MREIYMEIKRDKYLQQLIDYMWDGQIKVITGIRRCGKSFLLNTLFRKYLLEQGVSQDNILSVELDLTKDIKYRNPLVLAEYVRTEPLPPKGGRFNQRLKPPKVG